MNGIRSTHYESFAKIGVGKAGGAARDDSVYKQINDELSGLKERLKGRMDTD